jgi:hypothetical protein
MVLNQMHMFDQQIASPRPVTQKRPNIRHGSIINLASFRSFTPFTGG